MSSGTFPRGAIRIRNANLSFGSDATGIDILQNISLDVSPGEFLAILGPSGCGKSTLLGSIAGFIRLTKGEIFVDLKPVQKPDAGRGIVFQDHNLFPWKTVISNVEFGLKMRGVVKGERREIAKKILGRIGLSEFWRHYPSELSGGMQQRVNLARVLVNRPEVLLMDEPFGALDAQTRLQMQEVLLGLWAEYGMTVVFVTHDVDEAILLSDRILIMSRPPGNLQTSHYSSKRRILPFINAVPVVQVAGAVDAQTNQKPMHPQEFSPLVIEQRAVSLQRIVDRFPIGVFGLERHHLTEEIHSEQRWFASLPSKADPPADWASIRWQMYSSRT